MNLDRFRGKIGNLYIAIARSDLVPTPKPNIVRLYDEGFSIAHIAKLVGVSSDTIAKRLRDRGVRIRPPGRPRIAINVGE